MRDRGTRVDLRVDDSGPGIPEDERDAVFDRFHRATDAVAGTGLGLAIADAVVRSTQGTGESALPTSAAPGWRSPGGGHGPEGQAHPTDDEPLANP